MGSLVAFCFLGTPPRSVSLSVIGVGNDSFLFSSLVYGFYPQQIRPNLASEVVGLTDRQTINRKISENNVLP